jgi:hypothetical protein
VILLFVGGRILVGPWMRIDTGVSLAVVAAVLGGVAAANLASRRRA